jgi:hypothetical protein
MAITRESAINRYIGLAADTKPTTVPIGSYYWAYDTKTMYKTYDGTYWAVYDSLAELVTGTFTSSAATTTTITAAALADVAGQYVGQTVLPLEGAMAGEARYIIAYNGTNTLTASPAWAADPDAGGAIAFAVISGSNSIVVAALGTNGTTITDSATTVLGAIGANNADNAFASNTVAANADGSLLERDEYAATQIAAVKAKTDVILSGTKIVTKTSSSPLTTGTLFNWAGSIQILSIIGRVTTSIEAVATTTKISITADALSAEDMCATLDINGFLAGTMLGITGTYADAMIGVTGKPTKPPTTPINATCITSGTITATYGHDATGVIVWEILWVPLNTAGSVTAV